MVLPVPNRDKGDLDFPALFLVREMRKDTLKEFETAYKMVPYLKQFRASGPIFREAIRKTSAFIIDIRYQSAQSMASLTVNSTVVFPPP